MGSRISQLPAGTTINGTEAVPVVQVGATVQTTAAALSRSTTGLSSDLSASSGSSLVGNIYDGSISAVALNLHEYIEDDAYNVMGFVPQNLKAAIRARTSVVDVSAYAQSAFDAAALKNTAVRFPSGLFNIGSLLTYVGDPAKAISILGPGKASAAGAVQLKWVGAAGGTIMRLRGACRTLVRGIYFDTNSIALGSLFVQEGVSYGGGGSSGVSIEDCSLFGGTGAGSFCISLGDNSVQVSEVTINRCYLSGTGANGTTIYGVLTNTGNTKNFTVENSWILGCQYGISHGAPNAGGAGYFNVLNTLFTSQTVADISAGTTAQNNIKGCGSEGSKMFVTAAETVTNVNQLNIDGCYWSGTAGADDVVIRWGGQLAIRGTTLTNTRTGSSLPYIETGAGQLAGANTGSVISENNFYQNATGFAPIIDTSSGSPLSIYNGTYTGVKTRAYSRGDVGGVPGALVALTPADSSAPYVGEMMIYSPQTGVAGYTYQTSAKPNRVVHSVVVDKAVWTNAALSAGNQIYQLLAKMRLVGVIVDTTQAYAGTGLTGTITLRLGIAVNGQDFILDHDVKTGVVTKGLLDADLGASITRAASVQGGYFSWAATTFITLSLVSSVGNLGNGTVTNLTAGSTIVYLITEKFV